jgi:hypothetical protein
MENPTIQRTQHEMDVDEELKHLTKTREKLDAVLSDFHLLVDVVISLEKRMKVLEEKQLDKLIDNAIFEVSMYG